MTNMKFDTVRHFIGYIKYSRASTSFTDYRVVAEIVNKSRWVGDEALEPDPAVVIRLKSVGAFSRPDGAFYADLSHELSLEFLKEVPYLNGSTWTMDPTKWPTKDDGGFRSLLLSQIDQILRQRYPETAIEADRDAWDRYHLDLKNNAEANADYLVREATKLKAASTTLAGRPYSRLSRSDLELLTTFIDRLEGTRFIPYQVETSGGKVYTVKEETPNFVVVQHQGENEKVIRQSTFKSRYRRV